MATTIYPGYLGLITITGPNNTVKTRCSSFTITPSQEVSFYNHVLGLNDKNGSGENSKTEDVGVIYTQRLFWRPSVVKIAGGFSFMAVADADGNSNYKELFTSARNGSYLPSIQYRYYCDVYKTYKECRINAMEFNITAGDVLTVNVDVLAKSFEIPGIVSSENYETAEKFITWDKVGIEVSGGVSITNIQGFTLSINNNANYIYTAKPNTTSATDKESLFPYDIRLGTQEVSGSLTVYLDQGEEFIPIDISTPYTIKFKIPGLTITMPVIFNSQSMNGVVGPVITSIPFVGIGKALGSDEEE